MQQQLTWWREGELDTALDDVAENDTSFAGVDESKANPAANLCGRSAPNWTPSWLIPPVDLGISTGAVGI